MKRSAYIRIDRQKLSYLAWFEKINCAYCGYANGVVGYVSAILAETEKYWCGIMHAKYKGFHAPKHHKQFLPYNDQQALVDFLEKNKPAYMTQKKYTYLVAIAGAPGSGKSTLAKALGQKTGWKVRSFGGYVREVAKERNLPEERSVLQELGDTLGREYGEALFTAKTISAPKSGEDGVILEGVRKKAQWEEAKKHAERPVLVYLDIPYEIAKERLEMRGLLSDHEKTYEEIIAHPMERERETLRDIADIRLPIDTLEHHINALFPPVW